MNWTVPLIIVFNVICALGVIFSNKYLFSTLGFHYSGVLTGLHFATNTLLSWALVTGGVEERNVIDWGRISILAGATCICIWFQNLSLLFNSVGFYQIAKLSIIPCTLVLQFALFRVNVTFQTGLSLLVLTIGLGIATVTQVDLRLFGFGIALIGVVTTSFQQIIYSVLMKDKKLTGVQLYYNIGLLSTLVMLIGGFFADRALNNNVSLFEITITQDQMIWIGISCLMAAPTNVSSAMLLAKTSPITFQVLGHVKTILVFVIGVLFFNSPMTKENLLGIIVAMSGVLWYSKIQLEAKK